MKCKRYMLIRCTTRVYDSTLQPSTFLGIECMHPAFQSTQRLEFLDIKHLLMQLRLLVNCPSGESRLLQMEDSVSVFELKQTLQEAEGACVSIDSNP